eukprot:7788290-Alexandrium_andersonii.AAC.1
MPNSTSGALRVGAISPLTGYDSDFGAVEDFMNEEFTCKVDGRLGGDARDLQEVKLLNRIIRWTPGGILYEAGPCHVEQLLRGLLKS